VNTVFPKKDKKDNKDTKDKKEPFNLLNIILVVEIVLILVQLIVAITFMLRGNTELAVLFLMLGLLLAISIDMDLKDRAMTLRFERLELKMHQEIEENLTKNAAVSIAVGEALAPGIDEIYDGIEELKNASPKVKQQQKMKNIKTPVFGPKGEE